MAGDKSTERAKPFLVLAGFLVVWWLIPASWKLATRSGFREFQAPLLDMTSRVDDLTHYWGHLADSKSTLVEKGRDAARAGAGIEAQAPQTAQAEKEVKRLQTLRAETKELEQFLRLRPSPEFGFVHARVTRRDLSSWWQTLSLRKGESHGLQKGAGVIHAGGVAGRIVEVDSRSAAVRLVCSPRFRVAAHFEGDVRPVTFQGGGLPPGGKPFGIVRDVPHDVSPAPDAPLRLLTSPLGETFPEGILIGIVHELEGGEDGLFKSGRVELDLRLASLREVTVLLPQTEAIP